MSEIKKKFLVTTWPRNGHLAAMNPVVLGSFPGGRNFLAKKKSKKFKEIFSCFTMVLSSQKSLFDYIRTQWNAPRGQTWPQSGPRWPAKPPFWGKFGQFRGIWAKDTLFNFFLPQNDFLSCF